VIYKFKSQATGDLIMLGPQGDELMRLLGREAPQPQGIVEVAAMGDALARLHAAIAAQEAAAAVTATDAGAEVETARPRALPLRTRLWPMIQMLERARAAEQAIVWGV
jgi:Domain of unknown function (DUF1840)